MAADRGLSCQHDEAKSDTPGVKFAPRFYFANDKDNPFPLLNIYEPRPEEYFSPDKRIGAGLLGYSTLYVPYKNGKMMPEASHYVVKKLYLLSKVLISTKAISGIDHECASWNQVYGAYSADSAYAFKDTHTNDHIMVMPDMGKSLPKYKEILTQRDSGECVLVHIASLEAVEKLIENKVSHGDLHKNNVCLKQLGDGTYRAAIIDFGSSYRNPTPGMLKENIEDILRVNQDICPLEDYDLQSIMLSRINLENPEVLIKWLIVAHKFVYAKLMFLQGQYEKALKYLEPIITSPFFLKEQPQKAKALLLKAILTLDDTTEKDKKNKTFLQQVFQILLVNINKKNELALIQFGGRLFEQVKQGNCSEAFAEMDILFKSKIISDAMYVKLIALKHLYLNSEAKELTDVSKLDTALKSYVTQQGFFRKHFGPEAELVRDIREVKTFANQIKVAELPTSFFIELVGRRGVCTESSSILFRGSQRLIKARENIVPDSLSVAVKQLHQ